MQRAIVRIEAELQERLAWFEKEGKLLEAQRLRMRTQYDLEMMQEVGFCNGIENYSAATSTAGPRASRPTRCSTSSPRTSCWSSTSRHVTVPQLHGQYEGDRSRKETLIDHGFRLPSAADNRPLRFDEFIERVNQVRLPVGHAAALRDRAVRPRWSSRSCGPPAWSTPRSSSSPPRARSTTSWSRSTTGSSRGDRVLVTTLTKKMAEDLTDYLLELGVRVRYLHSEVDTIQRIEILRDLRLGEFDVLVGINLLREGLDLPEVSLVAILDADKEGFLRSETSLIQTIGRAARNVDGQVIMYADKVTDSMQRAISETNRRRGAAAGLQRRARHRPADHPQGGHRHPRPPAARRRRHGAPCPARTGASRRRDQHAQPTSPSCRATSWPGSSARSRRRCTRRPPTCASSTPPASATRSTT